MQYKVTCRKCSGKFKLNADAGFKARCTCPYCGQELIVNFPKNDNTLPNSREREAQANVASRQGQNVKKSSGMRTLMMVLTLILLALIGIGAYYGWGIYSKQKSAERRMARKRHRDSVENIIKAKQAKADSLRRMADYHTSVCRFLKNFYEKSVLTDDDPMRYRHYLTDKCLKMIFGDASDSFDIDASAAWWGAFGTQSGLEIREELLQNLEVTHKDGQWYKVRLTQDGETEYHEIKIVATNGKVLIDEVI